MRAFPAGIGTTASVARGSMRKFATRSTSPYSWKGLWQASLMRYGGQLPSLDIVKPPYIPIDVPCCLRVVSLSPSFFWLIPIQI